MPKPYDILEDRENLRNGYLFGVPTWYTEFHLGTDYIAPKGTPIYAHGACSIKYTFGVQGGHTMHMKDEWGKFIRHMHCSEWKTGDFEMGEKIGAIGGVKGEYGSGYSTGPHLHTDVSLSGKLELGNLDNFFDPEIYFRTPYKVLIVANRSKWIKAEMLQPVREFFPIRVNFDVTHTDFDIPIKNDLVDDPFWETNIQPIAQDYDCVILSMGKEQWKIKGSAGYAMNKVYRKSLKRVDMRADKKGRRTKNWGWEGDNELLGRVRHELCHIFYDEIGQNKKDKTHDFEKEKKIEKVIKDIKWEKIRNIKPTIIKKPMDNTFVRVVKDQDSAAVGFFLPATSPEAIKNLAKFYNKPVPEMEDGSIDWEKFKEGTVKLNKPL